MKKFLTFVLVLAMVMSVSSFAMAAGTELPAPINGVITLTEDVVLSVTYKVEAGTTLTLDLNGYNITSGLQYDTTKHIYPLDVYGTLTIQDSGTDGSITGRGIYVRDGAKLTVNSGSIYAIDSNGGSALYMYGGDVIINGGHIEQRAEGTKNFAINAAGGTVTVNGGWVGGNHGAIAAVGAAVVINDGKFVCTGTAGMTDNVLYSYDSGTITINGGSFTADGDGPSGGCCVYDANGGVTINDGTFSDSSGGDVWGTTGTTINGGNFENLIEKSHIAEGAIIINTGKTYAKTDSGLEEVTDNACTITFHMNDGSSKTVTQPVIKGEDRTLRANTFIRDNHTFDGWNTASDGSGTVYADGATFNTSDNTDLYAQWKADALAPSDDPTNEPTVPAKSRDSIKVTYNGGNSFSTSKSAVPTSVEIDGVAVPFSGDGMLFTVNSIPAGAKWVTVRWNSTSVTVNFTPNGTYAAQVEIPKTGDMPLWAAIAAVFGF